ncbi:MAG: sensor domain-containing diguanylate cyclase [Terriglobales bacterium]|jgi:diguanylate cyclase (GGDEF)-like protein
MATTLTLDLRRFPRQTQGVLNRPGWFLVFLFAIFMSTQAAGFLFLGMNRWGLGLSESMLVLESILALGCTWAAFRRARGVMAIFWFLFALDLALLLIPTVLQAYDTLWNQTILSDPTRALLYCLYGAPILMMLFLPNAYGSARVKSEIFLDLFQIAVVVGLIYSTFFFLPLSRMLPNAQIVRSISLSDLQSLLLLVAAFVRLQFARVPGTRNLLLRLALFLLVCAIATCTGDWLYLRNETAANWFDLGWAVPQLAAGLIAITWTRPPDLPRAEAPSFFSFLGTNLVLVAMLSCVNLLTDRWKQTQGEVLTDAAIVASLLAFTFRLALTQFHQQQEIAQRKAAQKELIASNEKVGLLLDNAQRQTAEITQISELGSILQACASREEVFRLIPERLRRLFPGASGCIALLSASGNRVDSAAEWGVCPTAQIFAPDECWALRRGCTHSQPGGLTSPRCSHLLGDGAAICIPLIANGAAIGILSIQNDDTLTPHPELDSDSGASARRRQLASAVAEHVAVSIANLGLRESLRLEAVRDALTGLYNRRYMQEFLDRELHSARRKHRPLAVLMLDLDHFKQYNDKFGHSAGDKVLSAVGQTLLRSVRAEDVACRYGGEEFALILPECSLRQATVRAEEIRQRLQDFHPERDGRPTTPLTASIGVAAFDETTDRVDLLLKFADDALYQAKHAGRNRVVVARPAAALPEMNFSDAHPLPIS